MATCTFCGKPAEKDIGKKGVYKVCAGEIVKMFKNELKGKPSLGCIGMKAQEIFCLKQEN